MTGAPRLDASVPERVGAPALGPALALAILWVARAAPAPALAAFWVARPAPALAPAARSVARAAFALALGLVSAYGSTCIARYRQRVPRFAAERSTAAFQGRAPLHVFL
jgi:hypothetical protein